MRVEILSGVSGSGKSTYAWSRTKEIPKSGVVSADLYFCFNGEYNFDPKKLSEAHGWCFRKFIEELRRNPHGLDLVIVDNTNTTEAEIAPYVLGAQAYEAEVEIITFFCEPEIAHKRNVHGVSLESVMKQYERFKKRNFPPWWKVVPFGWGTRNETGT